MNSIDASQPPGMYRERSAVLVQDPELVAGQRLMVGFEGTALNDELKTLIGELKVGGIILFACNIESASQVRRLCRDAQDYALSQNLPPLIIAVDQEGGSVARLKEPDFTHFPGNAHINETASAERFACVTSKELLSVHINMNYAPVIDVIPNKNEMPEGFKSVMAKRAFPGTPQQVGKLGAKVIEGLQKNGIMAVAKHFPGIGRTTLDSHLTLPVLDAPADLLMATDLAPFRAAIAAGVSGIMLSHILYSNIDDTWPASLSYTIAKLLLRDEMGYDGVIMTDDLDMKAIRYDIETSIHQIMVAEVDLALICHKGPDIEKAFHCLMEGMSKEERLLKTGLASFHRIERLKRACIAWPPSPKN